MIVNEQSHRNSIHLQDATVISHEHYDGQQHILRLSAPKCAENASAGQFVHLQCDDLLPLRRPLSIMRSNKDSGTIDLLYKTVGYGTRLLTAKQAGDRLSLLGPIGQPFRLNEKRPERLLIGGGVGIPPMIFLAKYISESTTDHNNTLVLMGSEAPFPFSLVPSNLTVENMPDGTTSGISDLEHIDIASRLASLQHFDGCYQGYVTDLGRKWLQSLDDVRIQRVEIFACGPLPMLKAVKDLSDDFGVRCQVSLEEHMACAVGGCAGCVVKVKTDKGSQMKRVCVDGPVFDAQQVYL
ncbi:MAG: dihydroorotate dehydrogenase electron transfer subunit [Gammaproteobacteria bacterium]|nr:MAG: dihydroorotate dehydrogenase electron transfer subunit [Gammaproteobacteria bacterium]